LAGSAKPVQHARIQLEKAGLDGGQRLLRVFLQIIYMFDADGQAHHIFRYAGFGDGLDGV